MSTNHISLNEKLPQWMIFIGNLLPSQHRSTVRSTIGRDKVIQVTCSSAKAKPKTSTQCWPTSQCQSFCPVASSRSTTNWKEDAALDLGWKIIQAFARPPCLLLRQCVGNVHSRPTATKPAEKRADGPNGAAASCHCALHETPNRRSWGGDFPGADVHRATKPNFPEDSNEAIKTLNFFFSCNVTSIEYLPPLWRNFYVLTCDILRPTSDFLGGWRSNAANKSTSPLESSILSFSHAKRALVQSNVGSSKRKHEKCSLFE